MSAPETTVERAIAERVDDRTGRGIAVAIGSLVSDGVLLPGDRLPTVRSLATALGVSASTVAEAWRILGDHGAIRTDRRRGTTVRARRAGVGGRYWQVPVAPGTIDIDLSTGTPDPNLLPPLGPALARVQQDVAVTSYVDPPVLDGLEATLRGRWPYEPEALTVVDGAQDAIDRLIGELVNVGDTVVLEDPTFPPIIDRLELAGARIVPVALDEHGPRLDAFEQAMAQDPTIAILQPRAHNPTGGSISAERAAAIGALVEGTRTIVIEDDHSGDVAGAPLVSVGSTVPQQVVHVHSFSKSHGPDLRIAAMGGPRTIVDQVVARRGLGPSWTSRLIQQVLLAMLENAETRRLVEVASSTYDQRRRALADALADDGVEVAGGSGLNMWVAVPDEQRTVVALAAHGIGAAPGGPFQVSDDADPAIRLSIGALADDDVERVAATIAAVASDLRSGQVPR